MDSEIEVISVLPKAVNNKNSIVVKEDQITKYNSKINSVEKRKRKHSENIENSKKIKRKKKDEDMLTVKPVDELNDVIIIKEIFKNSAENAPINVHSIETLESNFSNKEEEKSHSMEKLKTVSAKKLKTVINSCKEALNVLTSFDFDVLCSIDSSLKILKGHNLLDNKFISLDTLFELVKIALETCKTGEKVIEEPQQDFFKIIYNMTNGRSLKNPKVKRKIIQSSSNLKDFHVEAPEEETSDLSAIKEKVNKSLNEADLLKDTQKKTLENEINEKASKNFITNYFKKLDKVSSANGLTLWAKSDVSNSSKLGGEFTDLRRQKLDEELNSQNCEINYLREKTIKHRNKNSENLKLKIKIANPIMFCGSKKLSGEIVGTGEKNLLYTFPDQTGNNNATDTKISLTRRDKGTRIKAKFLQFHDNKRPAYFGTWRKKSTNVSARRPFGRDQVLNYDVDSDEEWEGEEEPGESLHGSDEEKEPEEDYEVDNEFFVPHGYLSDDENPEKENLPLRTKLNLLEQQLSSELNQKSKKMVPIVFGCLWTQKGEPREGDSSESCYKYSVAKKLQYVSWVSLPIQVKLRDVKKYDEDKSERQSTGRLKKPKLKATFPINEVPNLIKIIHGSPKNSDHLAKKFLSQWQSSENNQRNQNRGSLTKKCVLNKIKELATWQVCQERKKMCWLVPKETLAEFCSEIATKAVPKSPKKCFIWKFVKKVDKTTGIPIQVPQNPQVVILDS